MFSSITWKEYVIAAIVLLAFWYVAVGLIYFRKEARQLLSQRLRRRQASQENLSTDIGDETDEEIYDEHTVDDHDAQEKAFAELEAIASDIRHSILEVAGKQANREMLLEQLKTRLAYYDGLHKPAFRVALINFIMQQAAAHCDVQFSEAELDAAWDSLSK